MSILTQQEKELCAVFIKNLYNNSFPVSTKDITPKVAKLVEEMLNKISNCSTAVAGVHAVFKLLWQSTSKFDLNYPPTPKFCR